MRLSRCVNNEENFNTICCPPIRAVLKQKCQVGTGIASLQKRVLSSFFSIKVKGTHFKTTKRGWRN